MVLGEAEGEGDLLKGGTCEQRGQRGDLCHQAAADPKPLTHLQACLGRSSASRVTKG